MMVKLTARQRSQLPTCYYEGYLEKRSFRDKTSLKLWTCLCGNTLFFFNEKRDTDYVEKVDLRGFVSITDDSSQDRNLDAARLCLQLKDGNIRFTAPNAEARELWKGYIRSVAELCVPASVNLLPGQIHMLKETVEKEKMRMLDVAPPALGSAAPDGLQGGRPACFHNVSRLGAELLLEREAERGNLLLRPGSNGNSYAVTTRQDLEGSVIKHYLVTPNHGGGFIIDVDNPVLCATLHNVINYLVVKTDGFLTPLILLEEVYEKTISFIGKDFENGERSVQQAVSGLVPPSPPPRRVAPRAPTSGPTSAPTSAPTPAPTSEDNVYLNDELEVKEEETEDLSAAPLPHQEKKPPKRAIMPPVAALRSSISCTSSCTSSSTNSPDQRMRTLMDSQRQSDPPNTSSSSTTTTSLDQRMRTLLDPQRQIPLAAISELKLKLKQKLKS